MISIQSLGLLLFGFLMFAQGCSAQETGVQSGLVEKENLDVREIYTGADYLLRDPSQLAGKHLGLVVNQTSMVGGKHLVDTLLKLDIDILNIFAPEHGFRGQADAGEVVKDGVDVQTGLPIVSLYGNHKKPTLTDLGGIDLLIFDIQDVGARFYTYISTLHYVMEACAEAGIEVLVLDRPNPNGFVVDGPVLDMAYTSFVGKHPVPVLHGMTVGEYAQMINGEAWLSDGIQCELSVIPCVNYTHNDRYSLPVKPSPNLPDDRAIACYPSTCFFEGTVISEGRGTDSPFQVFGAPELDSALCSFTFTPISKSGAKHPKFEGKTCYGFSIVDVPNDFEEQMGINLNYLIHLYNLYPEPAAFFLANGFFDKLAGGKALREAIINGQTAEEIKASWQDDLLVFKAKRKQYLLYPDFE